MRRACWSEEEQALETEGPETEGHDRVIERGCKSPLRIRCVDVLADDLVSL
jgi:hypothetical protein